NRYARYVTEQAPDAAEPGPIVDLSGRYLGQHNGIVNYTVGQRKGLGLTSPEPLFVIGIEPERNVVVVGPDKDLRSRALVAEDLNLVALAELSGPIRCRARIRYRMSEAPATLEPLPEEGEGVARVVFDEPQRAITPGQSVVLYEDDVVLAGGIIRRADA
ncbi:MAG TPA: aminomethyltransferase beta-barrel domain-containing protein, partial [Chloroflexota bacterium]|nr:aminomethyltransferase beta-barrel domain-containing protein [Chloroflexota bacterium]